MSGTFLKPCVWLLRGFCMASWLPRSFRIASAWLCSDPAIPDSFPIGYMLDHHYQLMSSALSACFPEGSPNIRDAVHDAEASRIVCGMCRSIEDRRDVLTMSTQQCRQSAESVQKFISTSKFCFGPKSRWGKFALSRRHWNTRKRSEAIKTMKGSF